MSDRKYTVLSLACLAGAILAPTLVYRITAVTVRRSGGRRRWLAMAGQAVAVAVSLCVSLFLFVVAVCAGPRPGESDDAVATKAAAAPVISALATFRRAEGHYPVVIGELAPAYIPRARLLTSVADSPITLEYRPDSGGYVLRFEYTGPGMNHCEYRPSVAEWRCSGYY